MTPQHATFSQKLIPLSRWLAVGSLVGLIVLGLLWELVISPLHPGGSWLALKVLPLCIPLAGLLKNRLYTYRWVSLLVWLYFTEGVVRAWGDRPPGNLLALLQVILCLLLFCACLLHVRQRLRAGKNVRSQFLAHLRSIVGDANVLSTGDLSAWELDWRKRERGHALAVVRPANTEEVAQVVRACAQANISLVPQGGNTGMVLGSIPDATGTQVVLSLSRMQRIRHLDPHNLTVTVEAGCVLQTLQEACAQAQLLFPLSLASQGSCTIGGNLATNAGGTQVVRYGNARELCLGLEVVTAQGKIWEGLSGLRKDNTGYDLRNLFIGCEGTLGIITAATLKLFPQPAAQLTAFVALPSLDAAVQLLGLAHQHLGAGLTGFEVMGRFALDLVAKHFPQQPIPLQHLSAQTAPYFAVLQNADSQSELLAQQGLENLLQAALAAGLVAEAVVASNLTQAQQLWHVRESIPLAQAQEGLNIKHDISLPISGIAAFVAETDAALLQAYPGAQLVNYGHLGDGNLHYNVQAPKSMDHQEFLSKHEADINALVYAAVTRYRGSISAEHGIGSLKRDKLSQHKSPVALELMHAIKHALDPHNTLNPGRVLTVKNAQPPHAL
jgi:FAD/FMN-containing dehydrogenase/uncharacterized membrane protein